MVLHYSPASGTSDTPGQTKNPTTGRSVAPKTNSGDPDAPEASAGAQQRQELLFTLQNSKRIKAGDLSSSQKKLFENLRCTQGADGQLAIFENGSHEPLMDVTGDGRVLIHGNPPAGSREQIDVLLKGALVAKAVLPPGAKCSSAIAPDEQSYLVMVKCAALTGLKIANPPAKTLDETNPALARKVEEEWARMRNDNQSRIGFQAPTGSVAAKLGDPGSPSLAGAPPMGDHFAGVSASSTAAPVTTAPPAAPAAGTRPLRLG